MISKAWDVFISHASEDKNRVARPLARLLEKSGLKVWLDEAELRLGDSLRDKIDEGLARSRYGVVILSPSFFSKKWTKAELDALFSRESAGTKVILPVWHEVGESEVSKLSPLLASRLAVNTTTGLENVCSLICRAIKDVHRDVPEPRRSTTDSKIREYVNDKDSSILVFVPGGIFSLGADLQALGLPEKAVSVAKPVHKVRLTSFWIGKYAVTNEQYHLFLAANPNRPKPNFWENQDFISRGVRGVRPAD